ncbi:c-type cytochrome [Rhodocista pekingensis]|uniref:C-type cytochrome n=1 Tax=Rhodocista pekingensis TaxID=201185 RepID=A0ABW2KU71_9PROT
MKAFVAAAILAGTVLGAAPALAQDGDPVKGEAVFKKCMACHRVGPDAKNLVGPALTGVIGRQAGTAPGFNYSAINHAAGEAGLHWTPENIIAYLPDPNAFLRKFLADAGHAEQAKGSTKMVFKLPNEEERKDVVAYLKQFSQ